MVNAYVPVLVLILGGFAFCISANGNVKEMGRISFFVGLLLTCMMVSHLRLG